MGKNSGIEWTTHTFNPWWGCVKVSPGCQNCYAETLSNRYNPGIWGPAKTTDRRLFGDKHWNEPLKWDRDAAKEGVRAKVFCASMADVFEGHPQTLPSLARLLQTIEATPNLIWLLLTKRPENIEPLMTEALRLAGSILASPRIWLSLMGDRVWMGTSVEDQARADERVPELLEVPAKVHFLSVEPLLGPVNLADVRMQSTAGHLNALTGHVHYDDIPNNWTGKGLDWVIVGGESGPGARPMAPSWALTLRDQCVMADVAFFFKQWGEWMPFAGVGSGRMPNTSRFPDGQIMLKVGKKDAGRILEGREWSEFPRVRQAVE